MEVKEERRNLGFFGRQDALCLDWFMERSGWRAAQDGGYYFYTVIFTTNRTAFAPAYVKQTFVFCGVMTPHWEKKNLDHATLHLVC
jgi:hypothetical protein